MRLLRHISPLFGVGFVIVSSHPNESNPQVVKRVLDFSDQPQQSQNPIVMTIAPLPLVGIMIDLKNNFNKPVAILKWNTILEQFPSQSTSITLTLEKMETRVWEEVDPIDNRVHAQYWKIYRDHFLVLQPGEVYTKAIDLRDWFAIDMEGYYKVSFKERFHAIFGANIDLGAIKRCDVPDTPYFELAASTEVRLLRGPLNSMSIAPRRLSKRAKPCDPFQAHSIDRAREGAIKLAGFTKRNLDADIWQEYFNGVGEVRQTVKEVYGRIESYSPSSDLFTELCDESTADRVASGGEGRECVRGMVAFFDRAKPRRLVFCQDFFWEEVQKNKDCEACGPNGPFDMVDAPGSFLHELTHVKEVVGRDIHDGLRNGCYGWKCVADVASFRDAPRFDRKPTPNIRYKGIPEGLPEDIASAYELHAYAVRAKACKEQGWPPKEPSTKIGYCWMKIKSGCKKCVEVVQNGAQSIGSVLIGVPTQALGICAVGTQVLD